MNKIQPEVVVVALFYKIGPTIRLTDTVLVKVLHDAAQKDPSLFGDFTWHPQYHDSKVLSEVLYNLTLGGGIIREGITKYLRVSERTAGSYGRNTFQSLDSSLQEKISIMAELVKRKCDSPAYV